MMITTMKIIVTGNAGFIGSRLTTRLLTAGHTVIGIDNFNSEIYDKSFKLNYTKQLSSFAEFSQFEGDIQDYTNFGDDDIDAIIHLAGYANVRLSFIEPEKYVRNNVETTAKILRSMNPMTRFIYASSSSVYGVNTTVPFDETHELLNIISPYAQTKKMCEDLTGMYCRMKQIKAIGLRFFTVYGRPDMAVYKFIQNIENETPITVFGDGTMMRDFTYIDDIIDGIYNCLFVDMDKGMHKIYNLGNNKPVSLNQLISHIEVITGKKAIINYVGIPRGEVPITYANIDKAAKELGFNPRTEIQQGLRLIYDSIFTKKE
jgi:UDP-glucuronate 4-epimerase